MCALKNTALVLAAVVLSFIGGVFAGTKCPVVHDFMCCSAAHVECVRCEDCDCCPCCPCDEGKCCPKK